MSKNILVIGNGYDLAHGLNTRYDDFIEYIKRAAEDDSFIENQSEREFIHKCIESNGFIGYFLNYANAVPGWVDLERLIREVIKYFELFFRSYYDFIEGRNITWNLNDKEALRGSGVRIKNCLLSFSMLYDHVNSYGPIYSKHLMEKYYSEEFGLNKREILRMLKKQLDEVIELLRIYLKNQMNEKRESIKKIRQIEEIDPSYVISFNYTDTYKAYGIRPEDVLHVHGSLNKNNMVLGFNDDDPENLDFIYFKKYFQRIQKLTGYIDESKMIKITLGFTDKPKVHFYGHSMDKTDGDMIQKLRAMANGFVIYKYDQEDYEQKVINLIDVFTKDDAIKMIETGYIKFVQCES